MSEKLPQNKLRVHSQANLFRISLLEKSIQFSVNVICNVSHPNPSKQIICLFYESLLLWNALLDAVKGRNGNEIVKMQFPGNEKRCIDLKGRRVGNKRYHHVLHFKFICFLSREKISICLKRQWIPNYTREIISYA